MSEVLDFLYCPMDYGKLSGLWTACACHIASLSRTTLEKTQQVFNLPFYSCYYENNHRYANI